MEEKIVVNDLSVGYGDTVVLSDLNFTINSGKITVILGSSGCGKTTILRMITGFEQVTSGNIIYDGKVINDVIPQKRDFGIVFQSYALFPNMTVNQNIAFGLKMRKMPQRKKNRRVLPKNNPLIPGNVSLP